MNLDKSSSTTEVVAFGNGENDDGIDNGKKKISVVGETTLSGAEYVSSTVRDWFVINNHGVSPCVPLRVFPINMALAAKTVSDNHIAIMFQVLIKQHQRQRMLTHAYLQNLEDGVIAHEVSFPGSDGGFVPGMMMLKEDRDVRVGDFYPKRLAFSNVVESIGGVPIHARDPGENSMARRRDRFLSTLKEKLDADERLVCKMLIVLEIWVFGHSEARAYGVDFVAPHKDGRILRWQETREDCQNPDCVMVQSSLDARLNVIDAVAAHVVASNGVPALKGSIAEANTSIVTASATNGVKISSASIASSTSIPGQNVASAN